MHFSDADRRHCELHPADLLVCEGGEVGRAAVWRGETTTPKLTPPNDLGNAGTALWHSMTTAYQLEESEHPLLVAACRQADDIARLEEAITRDGCIVEGSAGQPRLNQAMTEVRQGRIALQKLLGAIGWPNDAGEVVTLRQRQARSAAHQRWKRN